MPDPAPSPELLRSLGQLVRGLSLLFWGLPVALVIGVQTAQADYLRFFGVAPPLVAAALPLYGLLLIGNFRKEERIWIDALDRSKFLATANLGLSPFLFWWSRMPNHGFYLAGMQLLAATGVLFLISLNPMLRRLTAMLPDETLRHETIVFTGLNTFLLWFDLALIAAQIALVYVRTQGFIPTHWEILMERGLQVGIWFLILLTTATTMSLLWKTKEVIFNSVFGGSQ